MAVCVVFCKAERIFSSSLTALCISTAREFCEVGSDGRGRECYGFRVKVQVNFDYGLRRAGVVEIRYLGCRLTRYMRKRRFIGLCVLNRASDNMGEGRLR